MLIAQVFRRSRVESRAVVLHVRLSRSGIECVSPKTVKENWDSKPGFYSKKPAYYLLDHGDFTEID